jgi:phosphatidate phosphatase APP1
MSRFKKRLTQLAASIENKFDELAFSLKKRLGSDDPIQIVSYRSYGTAQRLYVKGRVLHDNVLTKSTAKDNFIDNLLKMYQRFNSDEIPGAKLTISFEGKQHVITTDSEGYFVLNIKPQRLVHDADLWHDVDIELLEAPWPSLPVKATAQVLIPPADAEYGIISDIDDTIIKTSATNLLAMSRNTFFHNAHTRLPFAGVSEFYRSLQLGRNGRRNNPFFYVSSSPWNLYDLLVDFLDLNEIPGGPLLLRDFGLEHNMDASHMGHKFKEIQQILFTYPDLNFVLIGDSGQEDPKIYREVVKKFPDRVLAIYIRDIQLPDRAQIVVDLSKEMAGDKVEMVLVDTTEEAAKHAASINLIFREAIPAIVEDKKKDKGELSGKVELS